MTQRNKKTKSSRTTRLSKSSPPQPSSQLEPRVIQEAGHTITLDRVLIGKRSDVVELTENELAQVPAENLIGPPEELPRPEYQGKAPVAPPEELVKEGHEHSEEYTNALAAHEIALAEYEEKKASWEAIEAAKPKRFKVNLWLPVLHITKATMDSNPVKIFHTLRGPVMAEVLSEDMNRAYVYSPCFVDPNIQADKIHFLPIAFAGFQYTIYKTSGIGESIPQEAEMLGYAHYINRNRQGDYRFRMRAAYHHIEAALPEGSKIPSVDNLPTRESLFGLVPTSNTQEEKQVIQMRQAQKAQEQEVRQRAAQVVVEAREDRDATKEPPDVAKDPPLAVVSEQTEEQPVATE